jgi:hypothetical protein
MQLVRTFFDVLKIACCCIEPAQQMRDLALDLISNDDQTGLSIGAPPAHLDSRS